MKDLRKLVQETLAEFTQNPPVSYLFHGTSDVFLDQIMEQGLNSPYLTSDYEKAGYYATEVASEKGGEPVVLKVKVPSSSNLRVDFNELDEPVISFESGDTSQEMNKRIQDAYKKYRLENPHLYDTKFKTINVDEKDYWVSLTTTFTVRYEGNIPASNISFDGNNYISEGHYTTWKKLEEAPIDAFQGQEVEIADKLAKHFKIGKIAPLGNGTSGFAYYIPNNRVLKITKDKSEVAEAKKIQGKKMKHLANVYGTYTLGGKYQGTYVLISELLSKSEDIDTADFLLEEFFEKEFSYDLAFLFDDYSNGSVEKNEVKLYEQQIKEYYYYDDKKANLALWYMKGMFGIIDELKKNGIKSTEWMPVNLGIKRDGNLAMYDLGYSHSEVPSDVPNINLNEAVLTKARNFSDLTDDELTQIAKWGLQNDFSLSGCWDDNEDNLEFAAKCAVEDFKQVMRTPYPQGMKGFPSEPIIYRFVTAPNKESVNTKNAGFSWFADKNQYKHNTEFFGQLMHLRKQYREPGHKLFLISARVPISKIDLPRTLWQRSANFNENEIVLKEDSDLKILSIEDIDNPLNEFLHQNDYPDFFDGQANPLFNARAYPPARNLNDKPLSEEVIEEKKRISDKTVQYLLNKMKIFDAKYLKSGGYGDAYEHNGKIIKFTTDYKEAKLAHEFSKHHFKHVANIEKVVRYKEAANQFVYIITLEKLLPMSEEDVKVFRTYEKAMGAYGHFIHDTGDDQSFEDTIKNIDAPYLPEFFDPWVIRDVKIYKKQVLDMARQIKELKQEVSQVMPASEIEDSLSDFHPGNIGKKPDGTVAFFDLQWLSDGHPQDVETIKENEISSEELNKKELPYRFPDLFDDFVIAKTEAEIREIAPRINLNQNPDLLIKDLEQNYPSLFDAFADWIFNREKNTTTLSEKKEGKKIYYHGRTKDRPYTGNYIFLTDDFGYAASYSKGDVVYAYNLRIPESKIFTIRNPRHRALLAQQIGDYAIKSILDSSMYTEMDWASFNVVGNDKYEDGEDLMMALGFKGIRFSERPEIESVYLFNQEDALLVDKIDITTNDKKAELTKWYKEKEKAWGIR
jgi:hypothetical protein